MEQESGQAIKLLIRSVGVLENENSWLQVKIILYYYYRRKYKILTSIWNNSNNSRAEEDVTLIKNVQNLQDYFIIKN